MNFDVNMLSALLNAMSKSNRKSNLENEGLNARKTANNGNIDKSDKKTPFRAQNGLGEQIRLNTEQSKTEDYRQDSENDLLSVLAKQNPMLGLLKNMQGAKSDPTSMLPLLMSLFQKPASTSSATATENGECKDNASKDTPSKENAYKKTQQDMFSPVAFAGYEAVSALCALVKQARRLNI